MQDKCRTDIKEGQKINFKLWEPDNDIPFAKITSVSVIPFTKNGKIVCVDMARGIDIPGGHIQQGEMDVFATATRECMEEAAIHFTKLFLVGFLASDFYGKGDSDLTYIAVVTGIVTKMEKFMPNDEIKNRLELTKEEFLNRYTAADTTLMQTMIDKSMNILKIV